MHPIWLEASFNSADGGVQEEVEIRGDAFNPACGLNVSLLRAFIKVSPNVEVVKKSDACGFQGSNFSYLLKVTR